MTDRVLKTLNIVALVASVILMVCCGVGIYSTNEDVMWTVLLIWNFINTSICVWNCFLMKEI